MSFEAESNSELTVIVPAYRLHFRFPVQNKIHKQKILSDTRTGILGSIAGPGDFLPARSDEFQKVEEKYKKSSLIAIRHGLNRFLQSNSSFDIVNGQEFKESKILPSITISKIKKKLPKVFKREKKNQGKLL